MKNFWSSFSSKLLGGFLVVLIPLILMSFGINNASIKVVREEVSNSYTNSILLLSKQIDNTLITSENIVNLILSDSELSVLNSDRDEKTSMWNYLVFIERLRLYAMRSDIESNFSVYLKKKDRLFSSYYGGMTANSEWVDPIITNNNTTHNSRWNFREVSGPFGGEFLTYIYHSEFDDLVVVVDIDIVNVKELINNIETQGEGHAFLLDSNGSILYSGESILRDEEAIIRRIMNSEEHTEQFIHEFEGETSIIIFDRIGSTGLTLGMFFDEQEIMAPIITIQKRIKIIIVLSVVLGLSFILFSYYTLLSPIHKLIWAMQEVRNGNLKVRISEGEKNEIGFMFSQFNHMVSRIDNLVNQVYMERLKQQQAQLKFLESQINPHFLYNCLNYIYLMSVRENTEASAKMALYLEKYFRSATRSHNNDVTLREEIDSINSYVEIQKMRFPDRVNFYIDIPEEMMDIVVPRLTLQPIIENTFVHGFEAVDVSGSIWVTGRKERDYIILNIEDNGKKLKQEELDVVNDQLDSMHDEYDGHGLSNTHWRLKLKFGSKAGIRLFEREDRGVKVVIVIPLIED